jgi:hypothetical protein
MTAFYPVAEMPLDVHVNGYNSRVAGKKLIYNADTNEAVSVVGEGYKVIPFEETNHIITSRLDSMGLSYETDHRLDAGGRKLFSTYTLLDEKFKFSPKDNPVDTSQGRICLFNSYDSSTSFHLSWGLFRSICSNGCVFGGTAQFNEKVWHTKSADHRKLIDGMITNLDSFSQVKDFYQAMSEYELTQANGNFLIDELVPDNSKADIERRVKENKELLERIGVTNKPEILPEPYGKSVGIRRKEHVKAHWNKPVDLLPDAEKPRNLWTLYNCFTNVVTHEVESESAKNGLYQKLDKQFQAVLS